MELPAVDMLRRTTQKMGRKYGNVGPAVASFVNLPTRVFDPDDPDKFRLPWKPEHAAELQEAGHGA